MKRSELSEGMLVWKATKGYTDINGNPHFFYEGPFEVVSTKPYKGEPSGFFAHSRTPRQVQKGTGVLLRSPGSNYEFVSGLSYLLNKQDKDAAEQAQNDRDAGIERRRSVKANFVNKANRALQEKGVGWKFSINTGSLNTVSVSLDFAKELFEAYEKANG